MSQLIFTLALVERIATGPEDPAGNNIFFNEHSVSTHRRACRTKIFHSGYAELSRLYRISNRIYIVAEDLVSSLSSIPCGERRLSDLIDHKLLHGSFGALREIVYHEIDTIIFDASGVWH
jgi:hypothetical protein